MCKTGIKEVKVNAFKCVNFVSFGSLNISAGATKTGFALVASACCMLAKSIFHAKQNLADANKQFSDLPRHLRWHLPYTDANCKG